MACLTLVGIVDIDEIYIDEGFRRWRRCKSGTWIFSGYAAEYRRSTSALDDLRERELTRIHESTMPAKILSAVDVLKNGLAHCRIADLISVIAGYLAAIHPCSLPVPSHDFYRKHKPALESFRQLVVYPGGSEYWSTYTDGTTYNFNRAEWYVVLGNSLGKIHPMKHPIMLDTRRKQILGLPLR